MCSPLAAVDSAGQPVRHPGSGQASPLKYTACRRFAAGAPAPGIGGNRPQDAGFDHHFVEPVDVDALMHLRAESQGS